MLHQEEGIYENFEEPQGESGVTSLSVLIGNSNRNYSD
jgi:hypothetical protein